MGLRGGRGKGRGEVVKRGHWGRGFGGGNLLVEVGIGGAEVDGVVMAARVGKWSLGWKGAGLEERDQWAKAQ
ncbi:unnamed protein product [Linum trigynum]|uniref:Uncharacterized protein n=1 Tax=Linum trigynum TaxID=586398 RepID=A0AAV2DW52_9ROSI